MDKSKRRYVRKPKNLCNNMPARLFRDNTQANETSKRLYGIRLGVFGNSTKDTLLADDVLVLSACLQQNATSLCWPAEVKHVITARSRTWCVRKCQENDYNVINVAQPSICTCSHEGFH